MVRTNCEQRPKKENTYGSSSAIHEMKKMELEKRALKEKDGIKKPFIRTVREYF